MVSTRRVRIGSETFGAGEPLGLVAGPCVLEDRETTLRHAAALREITGRLGMPFVFKASFDKANRSSHRSFRGPGLEGGLRLLEEVKRETGAPVLTDVHEAWQAELAAEVADVLQVPAFLCRQTDLLLACGRTGKAVNIKKGQFLAPWDVRGAVEKVVSTGNEAILVTERGSCFGYNNLVVDFRSLPILAELGFPVVFDAGHSVQFPGGLGERSGGDRRMIPVLARAAVAVGVDALFLEVHEDPDRAPSDGPNSFPLGATETLLLEVLRIDRARRGA
ncbi:MAG: 2-dehydro-3-deoxyphosphooctonate aldolase [Candidatus Binatia bacterium]|nr:MAG: 2-dehydro-3-deoxyphosphooctonate aldolase [Candidatus Binatia bacterium]